MIGEGPDHVRQMAAHLLGGAASGNLAHDAHIAALVVEHGVTELLTADRDFARFPGVRTRNPFVS
jgi:predicted nucleic acid-binding protein